MTWTCLSIGILWYHIIAYKLIVNTILTCNFPEWYLFKMNLKLYILSLRVTLTSGFNELRNYYKKKAVPLQFRWVIIAIASHVGFQKPYLDSKLREILELKSTRFWSLKPNKTLFGIAGSLLQYTKFKENAFLNWFLNCTKSFFFNNISLNLYSQL